MSLDLEPNTIHVWMTFFDEIHDEALLRRFLSFLSAAELSRHSRFRFETDRKRYLVTRALVRTVLSHYASIEPRDWRFINNDYGCPVISNDGVEARRLNFNISHTNHVVMLGIASGRRIGVDIENCRLRAAALDIVDNFFAQEEIATLRSLPAEDQDDRFFAYWTLKESYIKARQQGLSIPLDGFGFHFPDNGSVRLSIDRQLNDQPSRWHFWQFRPGSDYIAAICAERTSESMPDIIGRITVPLTGEVVYSQLLMERKSQ